MNETPVPSSVRQNPYVQIVDNVVICNGPGRRHRAFPTGVRLPDGDVLVGFRVARDHWMTADDAFCVSRSSDGGRTWGLSVPLVALPGWGVNGVIGQYPDGVLPMDEPYLRARVQLYRWRADMPANETWRENPFYWTISRDLGRSWEPMFLMYDTIAEVETDRRLKKFWGLAPHSNESTIHRLPDGRLMGLFVGREDLMVYNPDTTYKGGSDVPMVGFCDDDLKTWTFRTIADPKEYGIGFSESDSVRLPGGRFVAVYGNNAGTRYFFETHSDDQGQTWSEMRQLNFCGDSPSMIRLSSGALLAAIRYCPPEGGKGAGIGLVASPDEGQSWEVLGNVHDQTNWDMGYPDLIKLADGRVLCVYYTGNETRPIPKHVEEELNQVEPLRTMRQRSGSMPRPAAFQEIQSEIRVAILQQADHRPERKAPAENDNIGASTPDVSSDKVEL